MSGLNENDKKLSSNYSTDTTAQIVGIQKTQSLLIPITIQCIHILVTITILSFEDLNGFETNVVVSTNIRITDDVALQRVSALRQCKLKLDGKTLRHRDSLGREAGGRQPNLVLKAAAGGAVVGAVGAWAGLVFA
ncbi:hypothetical protein K443DRAFT_5609 [Laccaria amethystina LaAM-08-1]|uniref:Uncharacterized protein n=1 Tax=Laccaria amethystina LaAM-08-1 TaxID=1095629 RepID=A0A0C9Y535_9AGAR|nr:hypothetical protein K443DRAFT_5609 [Laccaria amethystina LaAM-08-1]